jgi:DNA-binding NarL/FixJ family response regulator
MSPDRVSCVLLAERHSGLIEGIRGLLASAFDVVVMVADEVSLLEGARRLRPAVVVVDLSLTGRDSTILLNRLKAERAETKVILLSVYDEPAVARCVLEAGAVGCVLKRAIASDLLPAIEAVLAGSTYVSPGFHLSAV